jgi:DNA-binding MurR/RpiR family transcriptional regulator
LSASLQKVALFILDYANEVLSNTAGQLAEKIDVSEASIIRFCKALGFKGYADFKIKLAQELGNANAIYIPDGISKDDSVWDVISTIMRNEYEDIRFTLEMMDKEAMLKATTMLHEANRIGFFGIGSSAVVANDAKDHFLLLGKAAQSEWDGTAQLLLANSLKEGDLAFVISLSGQSAIPLKILEIAESKGVHRIGLTQNPRSDLVQKCDCALLAFKKSTSVEDLTTSSRIIFSAILDALAVACAAFNWDEYARNIQSTRKNLIV